MVTNFPMYSLEGPILTSTHGGYKAPTLKADLGCFVRAPFVMIQAIRSNILLVLGMLTAAEEPRLSL